MLHQAENALLRLTAPGGGLVPAGEEAVAVAVPTTVVPLARPVTAAAQPPARPARNARPQSAGRRRPQSAPMQRNPPLRSAAQDPSTVRIVRGDASVAPDAAVSGRPDPEIMQIASMLRGLNPSSGSAAADSTPSKPPRHPTKSGRPTPSSPPADAPSPPVKPPRAPGSWDNSPLHASRTVDHQKDKDGAQVLRLTQVRGLAGG